MVQIKKKFCFKFEAIQIYNIGLNNYIFEFVFIMVVIENNMTKIRYFCDYYRGVALIF